MASDLDPNELAVLRVHAGAELDVLRRVMLDVDAPPVFLFSDDRPRLVEARERATDVIDRWVVSQPESARRIYSKVRGVNRRQSVAESLLIAVTSADYFDLSTEVLTSPATDSRVFVAAPHLVPLMDERGLVRVAGLDARPWGLHTGDYAFHYHQLLRRGFRSGIHYGLIGSVLRAADEWGLEARLALDERRVRFADEYQEFHEHDYWFGPPLIEDDLDNLSAVGETFHGDPEGGTSWLNPYAGLSVRWAADGPRKVVEIEEFMPPPVGGAQWVLARYLHAIRDTDKRTFVHCDGAVKAFDAANYPQTQHGFKSRGKGNHYRKLFRIDGEFPATVWSELASSWFRGNRLIHEYLGTLAGGSETATV